MAPGGAPSFPGGFLRLTPETIDAGSAPVCLHHDMYMKSNATLELSAPASARVEIAPGIHVWSTAPVFVHTIKEAMIRSTYPLGPAFAEGWSKLPAELKLRIIAVHIGPSYHNLGSLESYSCAEVFHRQVGPFLRLTPEIAALATEIFYNKHVFYTSGYFGYDSGQFKYPPRAVNCHILNLKFEMNPSDLEWRRLMRLSNGAFGFEKLKYIKVIVNWRATKLTGDARQMLHYRSQSWIKSAIREETGEIHFACNGVVEFVGQPTFQKPGPRYPLDQMMQNMENSLRRRILFSGKH